MLIKSQNENIIFCFDSGCYIEVLAPTSVDGIYLIAHSATTMEEEGVEIGAYKSIDDARTILRGIMNSYSNGEKCYEVDYADARHWGGKYD